MKETNPFEEKAEVRINYETCAVCGQCVTVCKGGPLVMGEGRIEVESGRLFDGCIACGQCVSICPTGSISVEGRGMKMGDVVPIPPREERAGYPELKSLLLARRSIRNFQGREVSKEMLDQILDAATTAPMGVPPSEVCVTVLSTHEKVREFRKDLVNSIKKMRKFLSPFMLSLMKPFMKRADYQMMKSFVQPALCCFLEMDKKGKDWILYSAPVCLYFYTTCYGDSADAWIAATYAMIAAESLGLGSCMLGFPPHVIHQDRALQDKYGIRKGHRAGVALVLGYPDVEYGYAIKRRFREVNYF